MYSQGTIITLVDLNGTLHFSNPIDSPGGGTGIDGTNVSGAVVGSGTNVLSLTGDWSGGSGPIISGLSWFYSSIDATIIPHTGSPAKTPCTGLFGGVVNSGTQCIGIGEDGTLFFNGPVSSTGGMEGGFLVLNVDNWSNGGALPVLPAFKNQTSVTPTGWVFSSGQIPCPAQGAGSPYVSEPQYYTTLTGTNLVSSVGFVGTQNANLGPVAQQYLRTMGGVM